MTIKTKELFAVSYKQVKEIKGSDEWVNIIREMGKCFGENMVWIIFKINEK